MFGCDGINDGIRVFIVYEKCCLGRQILRDSIGQNMFVNFGKYRLKWVKK
jgi:hypothetical protein